MLEKGRREFMALLGGAAAWPIAGLPFCCDKTCSRAPKTRH